MLVDKDTFINYYKNKGLMDIMHGLSWVTESFGILDQLRCDPTNTSVKSRLIHHVIPALKKEPVGENAYQKLNEIEGYIKMNNSLDALEARIDILLCELIKGYRTLLQKFVSK